MQNSPAGCRGPLHQIGQSGTEAIVEMVGHQETAMGSELTATTGQKAAQLLFAVEETATGKSIANHKIHGLRKLEISGVSRAEGHGKGGKRLQSPLTL